MLAHPKYAANLKSTIGHASDATKADMANSATEILLGADPYEVLQKRADMIVAEGGDPSDTLAEMQKPPEEIKQNAKNLLAIYDPEAYKSYESAQGGGDPFTLSEGQVRFDAQNREIARGVEKTEALKHGTGELTGYTFDNGKWSINPETKAALAQDSQEKALKDGMLDNKDLLGVNSKISALTKESVAIRESANALSALGKSASPASQLAAIFKFMKALDPTSVVRESEQGMVYAAQGAAESLAGKMNSLMGEGGLTAKGFEDIIQTSKIMANSSIEAAGQEVSGYLDPFSHKMTETMLSKLSARVPMPFQMAEAVAGPEVVIRHRKHGNITEAMIQNIMEKTGHDRPQVVSGLNATNIQGAGRGRN